MKYLLISFLSISNLFTFDSEVDVNKRKALIIEASSHIGVGYAYGGSDLKGFDCSGFTKYIYKKTLNLDLPHASYLQSRRGKKINYKNVAEGDLIFFEKNEKINHVGIIVKINKNELWVIHSTTSKGVILEDIKKSTYWQHKITSFCTLL